MKKRVTETLLSIAIVASGFYLFYINAADPEKASLISMGIALILIGMGVIMLFRSGRHDHTKIIMSEPTYGVGDQSLLSRHKDIIHTFEKHSRMRDKLRAISHIEP